MWGDLLWANGSEQVLHVVHAGHVDWGALGVIRMNVSDLHVGESCLVVVGLTILSLVRWLNTKYAANGLDQKE